MTGVVVEDKYRFHIVEVVGLWQLSLELTDVLKELRPFSFRSELDKVEAVPGTKRQPDRAVDSGIEPPLCSGVEVRVPCRAPASLESRERVATTVVRSTKQDRHVQRSFIEKK